MQLPDVLGFSEDIIAPYGKVRNDGNNRKFNILDELNRLREKQFWFKGFRSRIQPTDSRSSSRKEENITESRSQLFTFSKTFPNTLRRPNTSPSSPSNRGRKIPNSERLSKKRPATAGEYLRSQITSLNPLNDSCISYHAILEANRCTIEGFRTVFQKQCETHPKNAEQIYQDISVMNDGCIKIQVTPGETNFSIQISKKFLKQNKSAENPHQYNGFIIISSPCLNTHSRLTNMKFLFHDQIEEEENMIFSVICGNGNPFQLQLTRFSNDSLDVHEDGKDGRILPGWQGTMPVWIPSLSCVCECTETGHPVIDSDPHHTSGIGIGIHKNGDVPSGVISSPSQESTDENRPGNIIRERVNEEQDSEDISKYLPADENNAALHHSINRASHAVLTNAVTKVETKTKTINKNKLSLANLEFLAIPCESLERGMLDIQEHIYQCQRKYVANMVMFGGMPALNIAVLNGNVNAIIELIDAGANPNQRSLQTKSTALHEAVFAGHYEITNYLLDHGARTSISDETGSTALHLACKMNNIVLTKSLFRAKDAMRALVTKDHKGRKPIELTEGYLRATVRDFMAQNGISVKGPRQSLIK